MNLHHNVTNPHHQSSPNNANLLDATGTSESLDSDSESLALILDAALASPDATDFDPSSSDRSASSRYTSRILKSSSPDLACTHFTN